MALAGTGIRVLAITNAAVSTVLGSYNKPGWAYAVALGSTGALAYVADGLGHLQIVNISTPRSAHAAGQPELEPQPGLPRHSSESRILIVA